MFSIESNRLPDLLELVLALPRLEQRLRVIALLGLDLLEVEDPEVGEPVDDEEAVVGLGHHRVVQQRQHRQRLRRRQRLDVRQLLDVVVGHDEGVQLRQVLLQVFAKPTANMYYTNQTDIQVTINN